MFARFTGPRGLAQIKATDRMAQDAARAVADAPQIPPSRSPLWAAMSPLQIVRADAIDRARVEARFTLTRAMGIT